MRIHIDVETFSSSDLKKAGAYRYAEELDFEVILFAYAIDEQPVQVVDLLQGEELPWEVIEALENPNVEKHAHNAAFERVALRAMGYDVPVDEWRCTMVKAAYCGLPLSLEAVSKALNLDDEGFAKTQGKALIKYFCTPCKPTKTNGKRVRNYPEHDEEKWQQFIAYNRQDVVAEREIHRRLKAYKIPALEQELYSLDQKINDKGVLVDLPFAANAATINEEHATKLKHRIKSITGVENANSPAQLKRWLSEAMGKEINSLAKAELQPLIDEAGRGDVSEVLKLRQHLAKTSVKKYIAMHNCAGEDNRARGLFQFYGANRTGRWAGRLIQLQNLPRNYIKDLELARQTVADNDYELLHMYYDNVSDTISQLVRTSFIAPEGKMLAVADFSAIEARVIAWFSNEAWRLEVFKTHGKIYEASASKMFGIPIEEITKGSEYRHKGKIAELALGYQGAVGALLQMGGESMGLTEPEMKTIVDRWRKANPQIVKFWRSCQDLAILAVRTRREHVSKSGLLKFNCDGKFLTVELPSGRKLYYAEPSFYQNKWGHLSLRYKGMIQATRKWGHVKTYGGKLVENIVQATARDLLAVSMLELDRAGFDLIMHVHDEVICEVDKSTAQDDLKKIEAIMGTEVKWAKGLPLGADGYITTFYKKD